MTIQSTGCNPRRVIDAALEFGRRKASRRPGKIIPFGEQSTSFFGRFGGFV
jgi:hypothetical protein